MIGCADLTAIFLALPFFFFGFTFVRNLKSKTNGRNQDGTGRGSPLDEITCLIKIHYLDQHFLFIQKALNPTCL